MRTFVQSPEGILSAVTLHPGAVATLISGCPAHLQESDVVIAGMPGFVVESVDYGSDQPDDTTEGQTNTIDSRISRVKRRSWLSWVNFHMERQPVNLMIE
jgi:hypothetical protein